MLLFTVVQGMHLPGDSIEKGKKEQTVTTINPVSNPANTVSVEALQQENAELKSRLVMLENMLQEEKSALQFKLTMVSLITKLENEKKLQTMEDLKSKLNYSENMANILFIIQKEAIR